MLSSILKKKDRVSSTAFSSFIRTGASKDKKKVFVSVLKASTNKQKKIVFLANKKLAK